MHVRRQPGCTGGGLRAMTGRANRLARIARKYAVDCQIAQRALVEAERQRASFAETRAGLDSAIARLAASPGEARVCDLTAASEWRDRLAIAVLRVDDALREACVEGQNRRASALRATGRSDLIARRIGEVRQQEERHRSEVSSGRKTRSRLP